MNGVDPQAYIAKTLQAILDDPQSRIEELMPRSFVAASSLAAR
jgi:hypothetical protein